MTIAYVFEIAFLVFLGLGIIFSFILENLFLQGITIFLFGVIAATLQKLRKTDLNFPYIMIIIGFVLGYVLASRSGHRFLLLVLFFLGIFAGMLLKKVIKKHVESRK